MEYSNEFKENLIMSFYKNLTSPNLKESENTWSIMEKTEILLDELASRFAERDEADILYEVINAYRESIGKTEKIYACTEENFNTVLAQFSPSEILQLGAEIGEDIDDIDEYQAFKLTDDGIHLYGTPYDDLNDYKKLDFIQNLIKKNFEDMTEAEYKVSLELVKIALGTI